MNPKKAILTAALGVTMSVLSAKAADIQITSLPFQVTASGHYKLTAAAVSNWVAAGEPTLLNNPNFGTGSLIAITEVNNVTIDLNGQTIDAGIPTSSNIAAYGDAVFVQDASNVLIKNGTISNFYYGVIINSTNASLPAADDSVNNIQFSSAQRGIILNLCLSPTIENCTFVHGNGFFGIWDNALGGEHFADCTFSGYNSQNPPIAFISSNTLTVHNLHIGTPSQ